MTYARITQAAFLPRSAESVIRGVLLPARGRKPILLTGRHTIQVGAGWTVAIRNEGGGQWAIVRRCVSEECMISATKQP